MRLLDNWSPPDGAGQPVACLATSFTFDSDFFTQDCLSRFLSLSTTSSEGDRISSIAAILEEEDRLSEVQVSVLIDRSSPAEKRNLRWDLLPVGVPGGLLHAKVAALLWERSARIIVGSANLTSAGYRRQVELAMAIELDEDCRVPRPVLDELVDEIRRLVMLAPGPTSGPKARAIKTVDQLATRIAQLNVPRAGQIDLQLAVAPARPGVTPFDRLDDVWRGAKPLRATMLSPFWDDVTPSPAFEAVRRQLTGRSAERKETTFVVARDPFSGAIQAPASLAEHPGTEVVEFILDENERRLLHAKLVLIESPQWLAALIGSSNATEAGLGLNLHHGHHELNLWIGCPATSSTAKQLRALAQKGGAVDLSDEQCSPERDEDEPPTLSLPTGFVQCVIDAAPPAYIRFELRAQSLPGLWAVRTPAGHELLSAVDWQELGSSETVTVNLVDEVLPSFLIVRWDDDGDKVEATWVANVQDRGALPPPSELADLPVDVLLAALASTRPLPVALESELRRRQRDDNTDGRTDLDPLRRYDDTGLLLHRARHLSLALWRLQERLARPATSIDALQWRLRGAIGPLAIADGIVKAEQEKESLPGEAHFLLAELALTVAAVDWEHVATEIPYGPVRALIIETVREIRNRLNALPPASDPALNVYVRDALAKAAR